MNANRVIELYESLRKQTATSLEKAEFDKLLQNNEAEKVLNDFLDKGWDEISVDEVRSVFIQNYEPLFEYIVAQPQGALTKRLWPRIAVAASIIFILGFSAYFISRQIKSVSQYEYTTIKPGSEKAILTLSDGRKVMLNDAKNGFVASQSGMTVSVNSKGLLNYLSGGQSASKDQSGEIAYNTFTTPRGGTYQILLPDGSHVWLNAATSLKYPVSFDGVKERKVELSGEAYFEVAHNANQPFKVVSNGQTVQVLGTHFDISAYPDESINKTTLLEGSVKISHQRASELLVPGQQAQLAQNSLKVVNNIDLESVVAWKNGYFKFNENLESIMSKIARWYNAEIIYEYKPDQNTTFSGELPRNRDLADLLKIIEFNGDVHFKTEGRRIIVTK